MIGLRRRKPKRSLTSSLIGLIDEVPQIKRAKESLLLASKNIATIAFTLEQMRPQLENLERHAKRVTEEIEEVKKSYERIMG